MGRPKRADEAGGIYHALNRGNARCSGTQHFRDDCRLVIVDFGLARLAGDEPLEAFRAKGTLPYLAPELFRNRPASARSDLYSLAAVLHEAIFGNPPVRDLRDARCR